MKNAPHRRAMLKYAALLATTMACALTLAVDPVIANTADRNFRVAAKVTGFVGASARDAEIAMSMIVRDLMREPPEEFISVFSGLDIQFFDTEKEFDQAIADGSFHLLLGSAPDLLETLDAAGHNYFYTFDVGGRIKSSYVLLSRRDSQFQSITNLKGARFITPNGVELGMTWMRSLFNTSGAVIPEHYTNASTPTTDYIDAVNKLYFSQADIALVTREALEIAVELNPQIATRLKILEESPPFLGMVLVPTALPYDPGLLDEQLLSFHESRSGRTLLNLFRCSRVSRGNLADLEPVRKLLAAAQ